jgi:hypothetical protein
MKLSAPKKWTWYVSLVFGLVAIIAMIITVPFVSANAVWFALVGWLLLILATLLKGF